MRNNRAYAMHKYLIFALFFVIFSSYGFSQRITNDQLENALTQLDHEIKHRDDYINVKQAQIDSLKAALKKLSKPQSRLYMMMKIGDAYCAFEADSALYYFTYGYDEALENKLDDYALRFRLRRATYLPLCAFNTEARQEFESIDEQSLPTHLQLAYYEAGKQLYSYIASSYSKYKPSEGYWCNRSNYFARKILEICPEDSALYKLTYGELLYDEGELTKSQAVMLDLIEESPTNSNIYARSCHTLASIARDKDRRTDCEYYLALSAIADTKGAVLEVMSLQELGEMVSKDGNIERAYEYLSCALANAVDCAAAVRMVQTSSALPIIQEAHNNQIRQWRRFIYIIICILALILFSLVFVLIYLHHQMHRRAQLQLRLHQANQVKNVYISQFFRLCSIYIDKLNQFCTIANRKIKAGQIDELYKITSSRKIIDEQSDEFYHLFDDAFLHIYPTFVDDVNALLRDKIILKEGELLNNDLRILAFERLGLDDTNQMAQILNYSVNTIYAYRNKLRNRAYDRENFEKNVMNIASI